MYSRSQLAGTFEGSTYTEHYTDTLRVVVGNSSDDFDSPTCSWEVQHLDDSVGWHCISASPARRVMIFDRALDLAREEARLLNKEIENPHKPDPWKRGLR